MITSLLDNDLYNFTMGQLAWNHFARTNVRYAFKNRTLSVRLGEFIHLEHLREAITAVRELRFSREELEFLSSLDIFTDAYLTWLPSMRLPEVEVWTDKEGWLYVEYEGPWAEAVFWETPLLSMINHHYYSVALATATNPAREGEYRLGEKVDLLKNNPQLKFMEFGTRRRFSAGWQEQVLGRLLSECPQNVLGTSNVWLSMKHGIPCSGTMAHQLFMVAAATADGDIEFATGEILDLWEAQYGKHENMLIALPDTWGTAFFLNTVSSHFAEKWKGMRQDSGDPFLIGDWIVDFYGKMLPTGTEGKKIVFSDGLDVNTMLALGHHFEGRIDYAFGWGTDLTNDCGHAPLSLVIKPKEANGQPCVKLSDNFAKATGTPEQIAFYKALAMAEPS